MDKVRNPEKYKELRQRHKDELVELLMQYADYTIKEAAWQLDMTEPYLRTLGWQLNIPFKKSIRSNTSKRLNAPMVVLLSSWPAAQSMKRLSAWNAMAGAMISRAMICKIASSVAARAVALCANGKMGKRKPVFANCFVCAAQHELISGNKCLLPRMHHLFCLRGAA